MKTYVITVSERFPSYHKRKGQQTCFVSLIEDEIKIHTIRANYELWRKRFEKIKKGEACLSIRIWTGKPYRSPQHEIKMLTNENGIGLQKLTVLNEGFMVDDYFVDEPIERFANEDGLMEEDFTEWFKNVKPNQDMAIIHFTNFRY